jgi:hypothetical protein
MFASTSIHRTCLHTSRSPLSALEVRSRERCSVGENKVLIQAGLTGFSLGKPPASRWRFFDYDDQVNHLSQPCVLCN